jgi:hypothetical protein
VDLLVTERVGFLLSRFNLSTMEFDTVPLTVEALAELRAILEEQYPDHTFSDAELRSVAHRLFNVVGNVYREVPRLTETGYQRVP